MSDFCSKLTAPDNPSVAIAWIGAAFGALTANDILIWVTIAYTSLKIIGWFIDRRNKRKETEE